MIIGKAKGILIYLLSKPDNWQLMINDIANNVSDGKTSTYSGIDELIETGYIVKRQKRDGFSKQVKGIEYLVFESPNLNTEKPYSENQPLINTKYNKELNRVNINIADFGKSAASEQENICFKNNLEEIEEPETSFNPNSLNWYSSVSAAGAVGNHEPKEPEPYYITRKGKKLKGNTLDSFNRFWNAFNFKQGKADAADEWLKIPVLTDSLVNKSIEAAEQEAKDRHLIISQGRQPKWAAGWISGRR
ncbi:MAG: hypothetical protein HQK74_11565, partial [Desulfamplus sp.]|nr:hypothetical protein [Desulfamplus sp.]